MTLQRKFHFTRARNLRTIERYIGETVAEGLLWNSSSTGIGRRSMVDDRDCLNFGSCSYMGLHLHQDLIAGTVEAVQRFGTQFSCSRTYISNTLYEELEALLGAMTGRHALVGASTTLCHLAALPVLVDDDDAVIIDQFAHASLLMATELLGSTPVVRVRHSQIDRLESLVIDLSRRHKRVWYTFDGLYSMRGDFAPFDGLCDLLARYPALHFYVDDAHSTSCFGESGRGAALARLPADERVVVALSLNKSFAAAGGALIVTSAQLKTKLRTCGGTMNFSGPIQTPMLGAAVASARLHVRPAFPGLQAELMERILFTRKMADKLGVRLIADDLTPIFMLPFDTLPEMKASARAFWGEGFYVCPVGFPAVPIGSPGIRFTVARTNQFEDIRAFLGAAARLQAPQRAQTPYRSAPSLPADCE